MRRLVPRRRAISSFGRSPHGAERAHQELPLELLGHRAEARPAVFDDGPDERLEARLLERRATVDGSGRSAGRISSPSANTVARSIRFSSSRTLPGKS